MTKPTDLLTFKNWFKLRIVKLNSTASEQLKMNKLDKTAYIKLCLSSFISFCSSKGAFYKSFEFLSIYFWIKKSF